MTDQADIPMNDLERSIIPLWNDSGMSTSQCAKELGITTNAAAGMVARLRKRGVNLRSGKKTAATTKPYERMIKIKPRPETVSDSIDDEPLVDRQCGIMAPGQIGIPFATAGRDQCSWPMWGADKTTGDVCGLQTYDYGKPPNEKHSPYCEFHHGKAYPTRSK